MNECTSLSSQLTPHQNYMCVCFFLFFKQTPLVLLLTSFSHTLFQIKVQKTHKNCQLRNKKTTTSECDTDDEYE